MRSVALAHEVDWDGWRAAARTLALDGIPPEEVVWSVGAPDDLFAEGERPAPAARLRRVHRPARPRLAGRDRHTAQRPRALRPPLPPDLARQSRRKAPARDHHRPDVHGVQELAKSVRRDTHKMRAFVRFREVPPLSGDDPDGVKYVSWFEPDHYIVEANAAFFVRRFATMIWSILTPYRSVHWTGETLEFAPGASRADIPDDDRLEAYWRAYYSSIFNPARLKIGAMTSEMPRKYWKNLPEAAAIPELIRTAGARVEKMVDHP